jgi:hypothetical protein
MAAIDDPVAPAPAGDGGAAPSTAGGHNGHAKGNGRANGHAHPAAHANGNGHATVALGGNGHAVALAPADGARITPTVTPAAPKPAVLRVLARVLGGEVLPSAFALLLGIAATLYVRGYSFGESNQTVYLLGGLRDSAPWLLRNDWLVSRTTEYHVTFGALTRALMKLGVLEGGFVVGYVLLVLLAHLAWLKLVRRLGGTHVTYLVSVLLYYLSNGGIALGATEMFQDAAFLPSNVANVAMLWGIYLWVTGRLGRSALVLGIAGAFHLNHAVMATGLWAALSAWRWAAPPTRPALSGAARQDAPGRARLLPLAAGLGLILFLSLPNLLPVLSATRAGAAREGLSFSEYVDTFVRLRAPHHFDPSSWPLTLWLGFLWPIPLAVLAVRSVPKTPERREACRVFAVFCAAMAVSLVGAGVWYVSEPLIQMCFYRFSIFPKLLSCIGAAYWLGKLTLPARKQARFGVSAAIVAAVVLGAVVLNSREVAPLELLRVATRPVRALVFLSAVTVLCGCTAVGWLRRVRTPFYAAGLLALAAQLSAAPQWLGHEKLSPREENYLEMCHWVRDVNNTPVDAVFLVPPQEEPFRYAAQRAIVVNFKGVPPLRGELPEWRDRLKTVLGLDDLHSLPRGMTAAAEAIEDRYDSLPPSHLASVARRYNARYVLMSRKHEVDPAAVVHSNGSFQLCDVTRM